jgi:hypothetical protein
MMKVCLLYILGAGGFTNKKFVKFKDFDKETVGRGKVKISSANI